MNKPHCLGELIIPKVFIVLLVFTLTISLLLFSINWMSTVRHLLCIQQNSLTVLVTQLVVSLYSMPYLTDYIYSTHIWPFLYNYYNMHVHTNLTSEFRSNGMHPHNIITMSCRQSSTVASLYIYCMHYLTGCTAN